MENNKLGEVKHIICKKCGGYKFSILKKELIKANLYKECKCE